MNASIVAFVLCFSISVGVSILMIYTAIKLINKEDKRKFKLIKGGKYHQKK